MLTAFKALQRKGVEKVIGSTPRDWTLDPPGSYFELHVRPRTAPEAKPWREWEEAAVEASGLGEGIREGTARASAKQISSGFRSGAKNPAVETAMARGIRVALDKQAGKKTTREKELADLQAGLDLARSALLVEAYYCESAAPPLDLSPFWDAISDAKEGPELDRARKDYDEAIAAPSILIRQSEPAERRALSAEELDMLFTAQLPDVAPGEAAIKLPREWSPLFTACTLSQALLHVMKMLTDYGAEGAAAHAEEEVRAVKKARISGPSDRPRRATGNGKPPRSTDGNSPPGTVQAAAESTGQPSAAPARSTTTQAA